MTDAIIILGSTGLAAFVLWAQWKRGDLNG